MRRKDHPTLPASAREIHDRIEHWRQTREKRSHMPADLWAAAVGLAREHGIYAVAQALGLSYGALKNRVGQAPENEAVAETPPDGFIELPPPFAGASEAMTGIMELTAVDGAKMVIRLPGSERLDVLGLAQVFWRRGA